VPKINAATIHEHVAHQHAAVVDAAVRLFTERGVGATSLGDIADAVGLKRTSLYRYFPSKGHLIYAWFEQVMTPLIERSRAAARGPGSRAERVAQWVGVQLDFLADPQHEAMVRAALESSDMPAALRAAIGRSHEELYATLSTVLGRPGATTRVRTMLVAGLIRSGSELLRVGVDRATVRREVERSALAVAG
jgi:AcrR family transcriptional regulator